MLERKAFRTFPLVTRKTTPLTLDCLEIGRLPAKSSAFPPPTLTQGWIWWWGGGASLNPIVSIDGNYNKCAYNVEETITDSLFVANNICDHDVVGVVKLVLITFTAIIKNRPTFAVYFRAIFTAIKHHHNETHGRKNCTQYNELACTRENHAH